MLIYFRQLPFGLRTRVVQFSIKYFGYNYVTKFQITR